MVLHGDDCEDEFQGGDVGSKQTSDMPVDFSSCNGKCTLTIYWLAFQNAQWQTYVNCVPLEGSGGSAPTTQGSSTGAESSKDSSTEKQATDPPSTEMQSTQGSSTGAQTPESPAPETPVTTTQGTQTSSTPEAPSTDDTKCNAPARRLRKKMGLSL